MEWQAYATIEPFGPDRLDFMLGQLTAIVANALRDTKAQRVPFRIWDFMPFVKRDKKQQADSLSKRLRAAFDQIGKKPAKTE